MDKLQKVIIVLFGVLFFLVPLILWPFTSEVFEFNKIVVTYALTTLIVSVWLIRSIIAKKFIFRRTILDVPLLIFLGSQILSAVFSIDSRTSFFGYYSRFNGGLLSSICYCLLYWAFVSNMDRKKTMSTLYFLFTSAILVSIYAVFERFGIDKNIWVQDVQNRVFSTLGQPNWLAAFLVALIPLTWTGLIKKPYSYILSILFFVVVLFTKSRSGLLGFVVADLIFWALIFLKRKKEFVLKEFLALNSIFLVLFFLVKTPFTSSKELPSVPQGPSLEVGGTESGTIRKIVWKGAMDIWKHYPIFGSGVETFAYSYYKFRPSEHNLVSEWDFIYNKAHNEYLNLAANSGSFGLLSYLFLIGTSTILLFKNSQFGFLAGYISLLASNFFGFSVVPTQLIFFIFPAMVIALNQTAQDKSKKKIKPDSNQKTIIAVFLFLALYLLFLITGYWLADAFYAKAKNLNKSDNPSQALPLLTSAINISKKEPLYHLELSESYTRMALALSENDKANESLTYMQKAIDESQIALKLSPNNVNIRRSQFTMYIRFSLIDPKFLIEAAKVLEEAIALAPTDAKLFYNLGLTYARLGQLDKATEIMEKTIGLKPNYKEARLAHALLLIDKKDIKKAKEELTYILTYIDPNDSITKQQLEELK